MNREELIDEVARRTNFTKKDVSKVVKETFAVILEYAYIETVSILNFGSFKMVDLQAHKIRNYLIGKMRMQGKVFNEEDVVIIPRGKIILKQTPKLYMHLDKEIKPQIDKFLNRYRCVNKELSLRKKDLFI